MKSCSSTLVFAGNRVGALHCFVLTLLDKAHLRFLRQGIARTNAIGRVVVHETSVPTRFRIRKTHGTAEPYEFSPAEPVVYRGELIIWGVSPLRLSFKEARRYNQLLEE